MTIPIATDPMIPAIHRMRMVVDPDPALPAVFIVLKPKNAMITKITAKRR
jgi:hypothetical protein